MKQFFMAGRYSVTDEHGYGRREELFIGCTSEFVSITFSQNEVGLPISLTAFDTCRRSMPWKDVEFIDKRSNPAWCQRYWHYKSLYEIPLIGKDGKGVFMTLALGSSNFFL